MRVDPIPQAQRSVWSDNEWIVLKETEVGRERPIVAREPGSRKRRILGMIENGDATDQPPQFAGTVQPGGGLPIGSLFVMHSFGIGKRAARLDGKTFRDADMRQSGLIGLRQSHRFASR